ASRSVSRWCAHESQNSQLGQRCPSRVCYSPAMPDRERNIPIVFGVDAGVSIRHGAFLPHWTREGAAYSVTFRLADSLPAHVVEEWRQEREALIARKQSLGLTQSDVLRLRRLFSDRVERFLDAGHGTCHMRNP